jgi:response regulator RpfG family c-di-GMP phosphodiesterase
MPSATVLVVEDNAEMRRSLLRLLGSHSDLRVEAAVDGLDGWRCALEQLPDLILSDYEMPGLDGFQLCRRVKAEPRLAGTLFVVLTGHDDTQLKVAGLELGVDDYLTKPVEPAELLAKVRAGLRLKALHDEIRRDKTQLETMHQALEGSFSQLQALLVRLLDLRVPGSAARGERLTMAALRLAARLDVPPEFLADLELAARLHEIGRIGDVFEGAADEPSATVAGHDWRVLPASRGILQQIDRFAGAAGIVAALAEHWDGTGLPLRLSLGQIPLRARILRVLMDFFAEMEARDPGMPVGALLERLAARSGTWYDPSVVAQLELVAGETPDGDWQRLGRRLKIGDLEAGMQLAEDLVTSAGVKLLARDATLTSGMLELIARRHITDPIVYGAVVRR